MSGNAGCNDYTGGYTVDGDKLTIGPLAATKKACGPAETAVETAFLAAMGKVATYAVSGGSLELKTAGAKVGLKFAATEPAGLSKTRWVATGVNNGKGAVSSVIAGTTLTANFAEAGTVAGSGGCNDYNGPYTSEPSTIKIGPLAATKKLCNSPDRCRRPGDAVPRSDGGRDQVHDRRLEARASRRRRCAPGLIPGERRGRLSGWTRRGPEIA